MKHSVDPTTRATILTVRNGDHTAVAAFLAEVRNDPAINGPMNALSGSIAGVAAEVERLAPSRSPMGLQDDARRLVDRQVATPFKALANVARAENERVDAEIERLSTPRFTDDQHPAVRAELRAFSFALPLAQKLENARSDPLMAASLIEGGQARSGLPVDAFDRLRRDFAISAIAERLGEGANHRVAPTADDPVAGGVDHAAARKAAEDAFAALEGKRDTLATIPKMMAEVVNVTALLTGETRADAHKRLTA